MAATSLSQVLNDIGAFIDQDTTLPTSTDLSVRVNLADQAQRKWAQTYQWNQLKVHGATLSFTLSGVSIGLDSRFDQLISPVFDISLTTANMYQEIDPADVYTKLSTDRYCYVVGNDLTGKALIINPPMASGASLTYDWNSFPSSLTSTNSVLTCPIPQFITYDVEAAILRSRTDSRFPLIQSQADDILRSMIEDQDSPAGGGQNTVPRWDVTNNFRIGG